jgi:hypothetical protein
MNPPQHSRGWFQTPPLTGTRIGVAVTLAVAADVTQVLLGFVGWIGIDEAIDLAMMVVTSWLLGFHWLLLPTAVLEFLPVVNALPTWTACVIGVVALRKRRQQSPAPPAAPSPPAPPPGSGPVIDV